MRLPVSTICTKILPVLMTSALLLGAAHAWPLKSKIIKKKTKPGIENYEPPAEDFLQTKCEPIRLKIVELDKNTPKFATIFTVPRREYLVAKHRKCKSAYMDQEYQYLKHTDVANPTLTPIDKMTPDVPPNKAEPKLSDPPN